MSRNFSIVNRNGKKGKADTVPPLYMKVSQ